MYNSQKDTKKKYTFYTPSLSFFKTRNLKYSIFVTIFNFNINVAYIHTYLKKLYTTLYNHKH